MTKLFQSKRKENKIITDLLEPYYKKGTESSKSINIRAVSRTGMDGGRRNVKKLHGLFMILLQEVLWFLGITTIDRSA